MKASRMKSERKLKGMNSHTSTNAIAKKALVLLVTTLMVMTSLPFNAFAGNDFNYDKISEEKT